MSLFSIEYVTFLPATTNLNFLIFNTDILIEMTTRQINYHVSQFYTVI